MNLISVNGDLWELPDSEALPALQKRLTDAMNAKAAVAVELPGGVVLLINGAAVAAVALGPNQQEADAGTPSLRHKTDAGSPSLEKETVRGTPSLKN